jgi:dethiobiotin synthetase
VGKTLVTALLLSYLRQQGRKALALKPFCSGGRADARLLWTLQERELTLDQVNPFHFREALAPLVAARLHRRRIMLRDAINHIRDVAGDLDGMHGRRDAVLLIEGAGGLRAPLGEGFDFRDLIAEFARKPRPKRRPGKKQFEIRVIVVAPNRLGTINHTVLTVNVLERFIPVTIVLNDVFSLRKAGEAAAQNRATIRELLPKAGLVSLPWLGGRKFSTTLIQRKAKRLRLVFGKVISGML